MNQSETRRAVADAHMQFGEEQGDGKAEPEEMANLSIKVSRRQRIHWLIEAKRQRTSLTAAIIEALNARFGSPD